MRCHAPQARANAPAAAPVQAKPAPGHVLAPAIPVEARAGFSFADVPAHAARARAGSVSGLPDRLRTGVERLSGLAMDDVRVHRNSEEPARLGALAYAQGTNIHLGPGQEQHLPHEAWHVVQQKQGRVAATTQMKRAGVNEAAELEAEADRVGNWIARGTRDGAETSTSLADVSFGLSEREKLSPNFSLEEFIRSDEAAKLGNDNKPTAEHLKNLKITAAGFEEVLALLGGTSIKITSGYRNPIVNKAVGGTPTSAHPQGFAGDFRHATLTPLECARKIRDSNLKFDQLILETSRKVVHLAFGPGSRRMVGEQKAGPGTHINWKLP